MLVSEASTVAAKPMNGTNALQRPDCVAGHVRFELRNVVANYLNSLFKAKSIKQLPLVVIERPKVNSL